MAVAAAAMMAMQVATEAWIWGVPNVCWLVCPPKRCSS
jgi:hypothetical protein